MEATNSFAILLLFAAVGVVSYLAISRKKQNPPTPPPRKPQPQQQQQQQQETMSKLSIDAEGPLNFTFDNLPPMATATDLELYDSRGNKLLAYTIDHLLSEEECKRVIEATEKRGYATALVNVGMGKQVLMDDYRKSDRFMSDDKEFARVLLERLRNTDLFPETMHRKEVSCLNERLRFLRYYKGGFFGQHNDGCFVRPDGSERSYVTLQLYLNTPEKGGATTFFYVRDKEGKPLAEVPVYPQPGKALIFQHNISHEGSLLEEGVKYAMRTDVMYSLH